MSNKWFQAIADHNKKQSEIAKRAPTAHDVLATDLDVFLKSEDGKLAIQLLTVADASIEICRCEADPEAGDDPNSYYLSPKGLVHATTAYGGLHVLEPCSASVATYRLRNPQALMAIIHSELDRIAESVIRRLEQR